MKPILCRPGGKKLLVKRLLKEIPPHKTYVEPFMGTGALFFAKEPAHKNILSDNDKQLMGFYQKVKKLNGLTCDLRRDKSKFEKTKSKSNKTPCDYAYITKCSWGCMGGSLKTAPFGGTNSIQNFDAQIGKLKEAKMVSQDFRTVIKNHDSKDTFFYLDPPYHQKSCDYPKGSCDVTPKDVAEAVKGIKGKFLLSYNDHPEVRRTLCSKYECKTVKTLYSAHQNKAPKQKTQKELIIKNY